MPMSLDGHIAGPNEGPGGPGGDGIESAMAQAKSAAGNRNVMVHGAYLAGAPKRRRGNATRPRNPSTNQRSIDPTDLFPRH